MDVAIVGAGAIGCALGGALAARRGASLTLVARGERLRALQTDGLRVEGSLPLGAVATRALPTLATRPDLLILATQTQDLDEACRASRGPGFGATVLTVQNGLAAEAIARRHFPPEDLVGCVTAIDAEMPTPGRVVVGRLGGLVLGRPGEPYDEPVEKLAKAFTAAGIPARCTDNLEGARWTKLLVNLNNGLSAATGQSVQDAYADARLARLGARLLREGIRVAHAEHVTLEPLPWASPSLVRLFNRMPERVAARVLAARVRRLAGDAPWRPSTLQTLERGRPTEVDFLHGEIVRRGAQHGIATPVNNTIVQAVHHVERTGKFLGADELLARVTGETP